MTGELDDLSIEEIVRAKLNQLKLLESGSEEPYRTAKNHVKQVLEAVKNQPYNGAQDEPFWLIQGASRNGDL